MDMGIRGRRALVNGASAGMGRAAAEMLAAEGVDLVLANTMVSFWAVHLAAAAVDLIDHHAGVFLRRVHGYGFHRFQLNAFFLVCEHAGTAHGELVAFTAHFFDDHRQMQHAATRDTVGAVFLFGNLQRHVGNGFTFQAFRQMV